MKKFFWEWAFLDVKHTYDWEKTYFGRCAEENGVKNLNTIRRLSAFFIIICIFVILSTYTFFPVQSLRNLYTMILGIEIGTFFLSAILLRTGKFQRLYNLFTSVYLLHVLAFGVYIGTVLSAHESAPVFLVVLVISQMLFVLPPILTTALAAVAVTALFIVSFHIKQPEFFLSDIINGVGTFILSILLGWMVNKIRVEEAFARMHVLELNNELQHMTVTDQLTALPNHRSFQETYYELYEASRAAGGRIGIIMMDIDKFKKYNDHYGHIKGDACLSAIGAAFRVYQAEHVTIYRFGGEEFMALLSGAACDGAKQLAEDLRGAVENLCIPHAFSATAQVVTASVGLHVGVPEKDEPPTSFIDRADRAMYRSKAKGGNCVSVL